MLDANVRYGDLHNVKALGDPGHPFAVMNRGELASYSAVYDPRNPLGTLLRRPYLRRAFCAFDILARALADKRRFLPRVTLWPRLLFKLADGRADHEFGGQNPLAEGHVRMMQPLKKHLHTGFANLFLMDADGRERWVH